MKYKLFKRASAIHAVKCNRSANFIEGTASFDTLQEIKNSLQDSDEDGLTAIEKEIENWRGAKPIVSESEINELLNSK